MNNHWEVQGKGDAMDYASQLQEKDTVDLTIDASGLFANVKINRGNSLKDLTKINLFAFNAAGPSYDQFPNWPGPAKTFLKYASEAISSGNKIYVGGGMLPTVGGRPHIGLVVFVPIVYKSPRSGEEFALIIAHLDEPQPASSPLQQGGVIHGPGV